MDKTKTFEPLLREEIRDLLPYNAQRKGDILLDANESPFEIPPGPKAEIVKIAMELEYNRYPDPTCKGLREKLSELYDINPDQFLVGNGGDEILSLVFNCFINKGDSVLTLHPTFSMFYIYIQASGATHIKLNFDYPELSVDTKKLLDYIKDKKPKLVILDVPNNPTGYLIPKDKLIQIINLCEKQQTILIIDEAYAEFSNQSVIDLVKENKYTYLGVLRTFSKAWGLAGLRVGYIAGSKELISALNKVKPPFNVNSFSQKVAETILKYTQWQQSRVITINYIRDKTIKQINQIEGFKAFPSKSNFVLIETAIPKEKIEQQLKQQGIKVKFIKNPFSNLTWIRLTIGKEEQIEKVISLLKDLVNKTVLV